MIALIIDLSQFKISYIAFNSPSDSHREIRRFYLSLLLLVGTMAKREVTSATRGTSSNRVRLMTG